MTVLYTLESLKATKASGPAGGWFITPYMAGKLVKNKEQCLHGKLPRPGYLIDVKIEGVVYELSHHYPSMLVPESSVEKETVYKNGEWVDQPKGFLYRSLSEEEAGMVWCNVHRLWLMNVHCKEMR